MLWLLGEIWLWCVASFLLGALVCGLVFVGPAKRRMATAMAEAARADVRPRERAAARAAPAYSRAPANAQPYAPARPAPRAAPPGDYRPTEGRTAIRFPQRDFDE